MTAEDRRRFAEVGGYRQFEKNRARREITKEELAGKIAETLVRASQRGTGGVLTLPEARILLAELAAHPHTRKWEQVRAERNLLRQVIAIYNRLGPKETITL